MLLIGNTILDVRAFQPIGTLPYNSEGYLFSKFKGRDFARSVMQDGLLAVYQIPQQSFTLDASDYDFFNIKTLDLTNRGKLHWNLNVRFFF